MKRQIFLDAPGQTLQNQLLAQISHFLRLTARNPPSPTLAWIQDLQFGLKLWISWGQTTWKKILPEHLKKCSIFAAEGLSVATASKQPVRKNSAKWQLFMALSICCRLLWPVKELYSEDICRCSDLFSSSSFWSKIKRFKGHNYLPLCGLKQQRKT